MFIAFNKYKKNIALNETFESYNELLLLAKHIFLVLMETPTTAVTSNGYYTYIYRLTPDNLYFEITPLIDYIIWPDGFAQEDVDFYNKQGHNGIPRREYNGLHFKLPSFNDFNIIKEFVKNAKIGIYVDRYDELMRQITGSGKYNGVYVSFDADNHNNTEINIINKYFEKTKKNYENIFPDGIIILNSDYINTNENRKVLSTIVHELQHAYDNWRSEGKFARTNISKQYINATKKAIDFRNAIDKKYLSKELRTKEPTKEEMEEFKLLAAKQYKLYISLPYEQIAFFYDSISEVDFFSDIDELTIRPFKDVYEDFINAFSKYKYLSQKQKNIIGKKFYIFYDKFKNGLHKLNNK
jgi:hypothetical protein